MPLQVDGTLMKQLLHKEFRMDKVIKTEEELGTVQLNLKNGKSIKVPAKTIYTIWESGRKDCTVQIQKPIDVFGDNKQ